ncbi:DUF4302 domain-containing protein [Pedobacter frigidisoli]|uniref:DUF4302 domain-containing protein n=1 Tax=Pedobacter frigidisoli TaxID=2530455 RepID=A0A4R0PA04_9SPHI|nr:DUF4302 domain-containing protein [Pedobacter frigidisoli]TCD12514.1 DUF4302 domain-containing protein [Pedobacter frigidisoli]
MKRLLYLFMVLLAFASCKKSSFELAFDELPEVRMQKAIAEVNTILTTAPNGWIATLPTQAGGGYGFYISFDGPTQVVKMYGDATTAASTTVGTSTFRVKANAGAELIFDTYNTISLLDDPNPASFGGVTGSGHKSDVEFIYDHSTPDSIIFTGKKYRQPFRLVKATAAQKAVYEAGGYKTAIDKFKSFFATNTNAYVDILSGNATLKAGIGFDFTTSVGSGKRVNFSGILADGSIASSTGKFAFSLDGASVLSGGVLYQGITFVKFAWKDATTLAAYDAAGKEYIIKNSPTPLLPLHLLLGVKFSSIVAPFATTYPGWSADFQARRASAAAAMLAGPYGLRLDKMTFAFVVLNKKMTLTTDIYQGASRFLGDFPFTYTKNDAGVFKFTAGTPTGNAGLIVANMAPLTTQRLNVDTFTLGYFTHPTTGETLGQFISVEHPDFTFTGSLL